MLWDIFHLLSDFSQLFLSQKVSCLLPIQMRDALYFPRITFLLGFCWDISVSWVNLWVGLIIWGFPLRIAQGEPSAKYWTPDIPRFWWDLPTHFCAKYQLNTKYQSNTKYQIRADDRCQVGSSKYSNNYRLLITMWCCWDELITQRSRQHAMPGWVFHLGEENNVLLIQNSIAAFL